MVDAAAVKGGRRSLRDPFRPQVGGLTGLVGDGKRSETVARGVEEAGAAVQMAPSFEMHALGVERTKRKSRHSSSVRLIGSAGARCGPAGVGEFELGKVLLSQ